MLYNKLSSFEIIENDIQLLRMQIVNFYSFSSSLLFNTAFLLCVLLKMYLRIIMSKTIINIPMKTGAIRDITATPVEAIPSVVETMLLAEPPVN